MVRKIRFMMQFMMKYPSFVTKKEEVGTKILEPAPDITSPDMVLTHADIEKLKVVELKEELKKSTCNIKGVKLELNLRLKQAVDNNMPLSSDIADEVMDDLEGGEFALGEKWKLEGADADDICIKEGLRNIVGTQLREPTVQTAEFVEGEYGAIKKITN